jgi:hypothetical protein
MIATDDRAPNSTIFPIYKSCWIQFTFELARCAPNMSTTLILGVKTWPADIFLIEPILWPSIERQHRFNGRRGMRSASSFRKVLRKRDVPNMATFCRGSIRAGDAVDDKRAERVCPLPGVCCKSFDDPLLKFVCPELERPKRSPSDVPTTQQSGPVHLRSSLLKPRPHQSHRGERHQRRSSPAKNI